MVWILDPVLSMGGVSTWSIPKHGPKVLVEAFIQIQFLLKGGFLMVQRNWSLDKKNWLHYKETESDLMTKKLITLQRNWSHDKETDHITKKLITWQRNWSHYKETDHITKKLITWQRNWSHDKETDHMTKKLFTWQRNWSHDKETDHNTKIQIFHYLNCNLLPDSVNLLYFALADLAEKLTQFAKI